MVLEDSRSEKKKEKFNFKKRKDCTICSIKEVEYFLCNLDKAVKSIKIYKFLK